MNTIPTYTILDEIRQYLPRKREEKERIRTIFTHLRKLDKYQYWSDIVLLNSVIVSLDDLKLEYSKNEIYSAFKEVDKDDYEKEQKKALLKNLLVKAKDKSIFG